MYKSFQKSSGVESTVVCRVIRHVNIHVQVGELLILIAFISVALRSGTFRRSSQAQFGQFGLLLLQTLFAPLDASVLEPDFDLGTKNKTRHVCKYVPDAALCITPVYIFSIHFLTWASVSCRAEARRNLSDPTMYCCRANSFSSRESCSLVKLVRIRFDFPPLVLNECSPALTLDIEAAKKEMTHLITLPRERGVI